MTIKVAINGYGRIGRMILRAVYEEKYNNTIQIVAINGLGGIDINAHLTQYDSVHGHFPDTVNIKDNYMFINKDAIRMFSTREPLEICWKDLEVDVVLECSGAFLSRKKAMIHLQQGAKKVLISAPAEKDIDATIVYGVNHHILKKQDQIISNASCTTNCLAPAIKPISDFIGIESGLMTTIHSYTNDQVLTDVYHQDMRRARSATMNMIPTKTGAAKAVELVLPELQGKLDGFAIRVPTINVSVIDFTFISKKRTNVEEINNLMEKSSQGDYKNILGYNTLPLVSIDFNHNPLPSIFDSTQTRVSKDGKLVKILMWYDNEWGYSCQMLNVVKALMDAQ